MDVGMGQGDALETPQAKLGTLLTPNLFCYEDEILHVPLR